MTCRIRRLILTCAVLSTVSACGGGDDAVAADHAEAPDGLWRMDNHTYISGQASRQVLQPDRTTTNVGAGTPSLTRDDETEGAYSGSALGIRLAGDKPEGTYEVVPDVMTFLVQSAAGARVATVECTIGISVFTGATQYTATRGKVHVSKGSGGRLHLSTSAPVTMVKSLEVEGGVAGAPTTMMLTITDLH